MDDDGSVEFNYTVQYRSEKLVDVEVLPTTSYPMVQASSVDGCQKTQWQYTPTSSQPRAYNGKIINYNPDIIKQQMKSYSNYDASTQKQTAELISSMGKDGGVFDYLKERWNSDNAFQRSQGIMDDIYLNSIPTQFRIGLQS